MAAATVPRQRADDGACSANTAPSPGPAHWHHQGQPLDRREGMRCCPRSTCLGAAALTAGSYTHCYCRAPGSSSLSRLIDRRLLRDIIGSRKRWSDRWGQGRGRAAADLGLVWRSGLVHHDADGKGLPRRAWRWQSPGHDQENRVLRPPVSETPGTKLPGSRTTLFEHALRLHQLTPDAPLPRDGEPYPDEERRRRRPRPEEPRDREQVGAEVAAVLDEHFTDPSSVPGQLVGRFHGVHVPVHPTPRITEAALRAGARGRGPGKPGAGWAGMEPTPTTSSWAWLCLPR